MITTVCIFRITPAIAHPFVTSKIPVRRLSNAFELNPIVPNMFSSCWAIVGIILSPDKIDASEEKSMTKAHIFIIV